MGDNQHVVNSKTFARPQPHLDYPLKFYVQQDDLFGWWVYSRGGIPDIPRREIGGPFWRKRTALRVAEALNRNFLRGVVYQREIDNAKRGGARIA